MTRKTTGERGARRRRIHIRRGLYVCCLAVLAAIAAAGSASAASGATASGVTASGATTSGATAARGTVAQVASQYRPKGRPPPVGTRAGSAPRVVPDPDDGIFRYAQAAQNAVADGAWGYYTVAKPVVAATDFHSLAELAVLSSDQHQVVEVGWTVDRGLNGDDDPHLFVYHWVDGHKTCYNSCGFVPRNEPGYTAGMKLPVSTTPVQFAILHHGTEWLVGYNGHWVGSFPDTLWTNRFKVTSLVQWFGEVDGSTATPCTEMGNGQFADSTTAARIQKVGSWPGQIVPNLITSAPNPDMYTVLRTDAAGIRFGGPGDCKTVPNVVGDSTITATHVITAAGLVLGTIGTVTDPLCEDLNKVISQSPAPGTRIAAGSTVSYEYGVAPASGCPVDPK